MNTQTSAGNRGVSAFGIKAWLAALVALTLGAFTGSAQTITINNIWNIPTGVQDFVTASATERGLAISPLNGHVYVVSRAAGIRVVVLDGDTGSYIKDLDVTGITGGTFALSTIGVADDGVIYAANLVTAAAASGSSVYKVYRWQDEDAAPTVAFEGSPSDGMRFGDSLDVRGAGTDTQIAAGSSGTATGVRFAVLSTVDGTNFTAQGFAPAGVAAGNMQKGISFGPGNTVFGKVNGVTDSRHANFDLTGGTSTLVTNVPIASNISPISVNTTNNLLAGVNFSAHQVIVYDISTLTAPVAISTTSFPAPATANGNGVGAVDFGAGKLVALDTQNGIMAYTVTVSDAPVAPEITTQPVSVTVLQGGNFSLNVGATGSKPIHYQWYLEGEAILNATNAVYAITGATPTNSGNYTVTASNVVSVAESAPALVTVTPLTESGRLTKVWELSVGSRPYLANDNASRGMGFNPTTTNVLVASRTLGDTNIYVLDGLTGADKHRLRSTDANGENYIFGGLFALNMVDVADDGVVYACNLSTSGNDFIIYRWADDGAETIPALAFGPAAPGVGRMGDTLAVRGAGVDTQIISTSNAGNTVVIFTTTDGVNFLPNIITVDGAGAGDFRLGVAFGEGNTFWTKSTARPLQHISFDLSTGVGTILASYGSDVVASGITSIGVSTNGLVAGVALETPDNIKLYELGEGVPPTLVEEELLATNNDNINGTGAVAFGAGRLYAFDSNNGLIAFTLGDGSTTPTEPATIALPTFVGGALQFTVTGTVGSEYTVQYATEIGGTWNLLTTVTIPASGSAPVTDNGVTGQTQRFYRVIAE